jgi:HSP20 family protein
MKLIKRNDGFMPSIWNSIYEDDWLNYPTRFRTESNTPAINIKENDESFEVALAAPGMKKEDFKIDVDNDLLTISAEETVENESKDEKYTRREFHYSSFKRSFTLPDAVDGENIAASYKDGVLEVTIPKKEEAKPKPPKKIEVS